MGVDWHTLPPLLMGDKYFKITWNNALCELTNQGLDVRSHPLNDYRMEKRKFKVNNYKIIQSYLYKSKERFSFIQLTTFSLKE